MSGQKSHKKNTEKQVKKSSGHKSKKLFTTGLPIILLVIVAVIMLIFFSGRGDADMNPKVRFTTTMGEFDAELYKEEAPISVDNFLSYVDEGYYDGLIFHRVIDGFMIQGGGFDPDMNQKIPNAPIKNEATNGLNNTKYTLAMARTNEVDSATSQFFINVEDNAFLDHQAPVPQYFGYAVFGKVISGFDTIDKIRSVETQTVGMFENVPVNPVIIEKVERI